LTTIVNILTWQTLIIFEKILVTIIVGERDRAKIVQMMISVITERTARTRYPAITYNSFFSPTPPK
ncbi:MAG TPA: hypothetical protein VF419_04105, partial [Nitrososphaeraceae archaeon]